MGGHHFYGIRWWPSLILPWWDILFMDVPQKVWKGYGPFSWKRPNKGKDVMIYKSHFIVKKYWMNCRHNRSFLLFVWVSLKFTYTSYTNPICAFILDDCHTYFLCCYHGKSRNMHFNSWFIPELKEFILGNSFYLIYVE